MPPHRLTGTYVDATKLIRLKKLSSFEVHYSLKIYHLNDLLQCICYDIKLDRKEQGKFYWKIPLGDDDATREK